MAAAREAEKRIPVVATTVLEAEQKTGHQATRDGKDRNLSM